MALPSAQNLVTLVFADIKGSTLGHQQLGPSFADASARMQQAARAASLHHSGEYIKQTGDGFVLAFAIPLPAILCACDIQAALLGEDWPADLPRLEVRIGIHTD